MSTEPNELTLPECYSVRPEREDDGFNRYNAYKGIECIEAGCLDPNEAHEACWKHRTNFLIHGNATQPTLAL